MTALLNHLWQSSLFAIAAGLLTLLLKRNPARVRYWLWFAASVKFLLPFSLLVDAGSRIEWRKAPAIVQPVVYLPLEQVFTAPALVLRAPDVAPHQSNYWPTLLAAAWLGGFLVVLFSWSRQWLRIRKALATAEPYGAPLPIRTLVSPALLEPGVFGVLRPVLVLPDGIAERLLPDQLEAIVTHELCHVRSRDNLAAAVHMLVEAIFWFHPLVWWIGKRLVDERERACDEEVLLSGSQPEVYAESILKVCEFYLESPLDCVSGITGSDLRKRIRNIMANRHAKKLSRATKLLLAAAGVAALLLPFGIGLLNAPLIRAQVPGTAFDVASIKLFKPGSRPENRQITAAHGSLTMEQQSLRECIVWAYNLTAASQINGPAWLDSEEYDIAAKADESTTTDQLRLMMQALLAERFKLTIRHATEQRPLYVLTVGKSGPKMREVQQEPAHGFHVDQEGNVLSYHMVTNMARLAEILPTFLDHPLLDKTGLKAVYDFTVKVEVDPQFRMPEVGQTFHGFGMTPSIFGAVEALGLKLISTKGPVDVLVVDHVERPAANDQAYFPKAMYSPQTFEVASVKPAAPGDGGMKSEEGKGSGPSFGLEHRRLNVRLNLYGLIVNAYALRGCPPVGEFGGCNRLSGGPDWLRQDRFEIIAKVPDSAPDYTSTQFVNLHAPQVQLMLQALLADRFALKIHREKKELPVYALTIAKKGVKFKKSDGSKEPRLMFRAWSAPDGLRMIKLIVENGSMQELVDLYAKFMDRPLLDKTGLQDRYDFTVDYEANPETASPFSQLSGPALFKAFEEQAGLKLEATKGPVEILVIDHAEKPSAN
jgi:bla regulator protein blaR1